MQCFGFARANQSTGIVYPFLAMAQTGHYLSGRLHWNLGAEQVKLEVQKIMTKPNVLSVKFLCYQAVKTKQKNTSNTCSDQLKAVLGQRNEIRADNNNNNNNNNNNKRYQHDRRSLQHF